MVRLAEPLILRQNMQYSVYGALGEFKVMSCVGNGDSNSKLHEQPSSLFVISLKLNDLIEET